MIWFIALIGLVFGLAAFVGRRSIALRARTRRLLADKLADPVGGAVVAAARVEHLRTSIGLEDACLPGFVAGSQGLLSVFDHELRLDASGTVHIPFSRVAEAVFMAAFENARSTSDGVLVRVSWQRAGERLESVFRVLGKRLEAERLRREVHLRAGQPDATDGIRSSQSEQHSR